MSESPLDSTLQESRRQVLSLGLPPVFSDVWEERIPKVLVGWRRPDTFLRYRTELLRYLPGLAHCVPLWQEFGDTVYAYDPSADEYVECYFSLGEQPALRVLADSYQRFVAAYLVKCVEAGEERLDEIATLLNFSHLDKIEAFAAVEDDDVDWEEAERLLLQSIPKC